MKARNAMTRDVVCIAPADDLDAAWKLMSDLCVRHLPVLDGDRLVGVLSDRDVLLRAKLDVDDGMDVPPTPVAHAMTANPVTVTPNATVAHLASLMVDKKIDCLPVVNGGGELVGMVTSSDLLDLLRQRDEVEDRLLPSILEFQLKRDALAS